MLGPRLEIERAPPFEIAAEPESSERGEVVRQEGGGGEFGIVLRRQKITAAAALEQQQAIGEHAAIAHGLAEPRGHGAEILADDGAALAPALERDDAPQILEGIRDIGALRPAR